MVFWIYNLLFPFAFVLMLPGYLRRMVRRGNYRRHFWQRFGIYSAAERTTLMGDGKRVWVQAVSVGEMFVALKLVTVLRQRHPGWFIILSTTTTTGFQLAREKMGADVAVIYTPIDLRGAVRRAFDIVRPSAVVIVDGGLWPNQLLEARRRQIPVTLANARLSPRSERRFLQFGFIARSMFSLLDRVCVPEAADVARWQQLGVTPAHIAVTGSIKYDDADAPASCSTGGGGMQTVLRRLGIQDEAPVLFGGSTHAGEERILAEVFLGLRERFTGLRLVIAPRHVERTANILTELGDLNLHIVRRTETLGSTWPETIPEIFLLDTTGELRAWYDVATVVFIGKSLTAVGGQNPAEAIAAGKPILFGPHMENFASLAAQLLEADAAFRIADAADFHPRAATLLALDADAHAQMARRARQLLDSHQGATERTAQLLEM